MKTRETIKVYIRFDADGNTSCICPRWKKGCREECSKEVVIRDSYRGLRSIMNVDKYGKCKSDYQDE